MKAGFAAIIGRPNVGKSTLMNALIGQKIAITSNKPQTTRNRIKTVYTDERGQIVFLDTPGIHKARNKLGAFMVDAAVKSLDGADVVLWLVEPTTYIGTGERHIIDVLKRSGLPVFIVINKTDTVKRDDLLPVIDTYRKVIDANEIIPVSALKGKNLSDLMDTLMSYMPEGEPYFDEDTVTDEPVRAISAELIREQLLRTLSDEIPHGVAVVIESMNTRKGRGGYVTDVDAVIICERDTHKGIIIGKGGQMLKRIGQKARNSIEKLIEGKVNLKIFVRVKKDWRDSDYLLKNYGYVEKE